MDFRADAGGGLCCSNMNSKRARAQPSGDFEKGEAGQAIDQAQPPQKHRSTEHADADENDQAEPPQKQAQSTEKSAEYPVGGWLCWRMVGGASEIIRLEWTEFQIIW